MRVFRSPIFIAAAAALTLATVYIPAQEPAAASAPENDQVRRLEQRIDKLADSLATALDQVQTDRQKMESMQAEIDELRKELAANNHDSSSSVATAAADQLQQAVSQIREEQEVIASEVRQHEQTKIESGSKLPVRIHGLVLFNTFVNQGVVDQPDLPTAALYRAPGQSHGSAGAGLRQTLLSVEGTGPMLWDGRLTADVAFDFFGAVTAGVVGAPSGIVRMRTAGISWQAPSDLVRFGFDGPLISPLSPTSFATVAQPALAWSGNLWTWAPQLRWEHRFAIAEDRSFRLEFGLYDALYNSDGTIDPARSVSPGEAARQPGYESRVSYRAGRDVRALQLGAGGYYDRKSFGGGQAIDTWAGTADWRLPVTVRGAWSGEFYRGRGVGSLGGGAYRDAYYYTEPRTGAQATAGLDSTGGWSQWQWSFTETMQLNIAGGQDTGYAGELRQSTTQPTNPLYYYARNRSLLANFIYRPWSSFILSPEFRHIQSWPISGQVKTANIYTLSAGYEF